MSTRKSINQRLKSTKSRDVKKEIVTDWANNWEKEQSKLLSDLGQAVNNNDYDSLCIITGELKAVTKKRFSALSGVFENIVVGEVK